MALAFSYVRFSSEKQSEGDSVRRQMKLAYDYAALHNLTLDNNTYQDLGMSSFKGKNSKEGMLGAFIEAARLGKIPPGSYLLLEALDRLTRADINTALGLFQQILGYGIILVTLQDGNVYSAEKNLEDKGIGLIVSIMKMIQGHEESAKKQFRVSEAWKNKRKNAVDGVKMTSIAPSWLTLSADRKSWIVDPVKAATVQKIYDLSIAGVGSPSIARKFNTESVPTLKRSNTWTFGVVNAILKNESVIGTFTPKKVDADSIKGYYPQIISDTQFYKVQEHLQKRRWVSGHNSKRVINLFSGICFCSECGNTMLVKSGMSKGGKAYIQCSMSFAGGECQEKTFPYYAAERAILDHLAKMLSVMTSQKPDVVDPRVELEGKKAAITTKIENLIDALQTMKSEQIRERITKLQIEYDKLDEQVRRVIDPKIQMSGAVEALEMFAKLKQPSLLEVDERLMIQTMMKRVIESVNCSLDGPTVAIKYHSHVRNHVDFINVRPFMDVGGFKKKVPA